jgi:hypothetical protein
MSTRLDSQEIVMKQIARALVLLSFGWLLCAAWLQPAQAQHGSYTRIDFPQRLAIEVPSDWKVLSQVKRSNLAAAGNATMERAGQEGSTGKKETLLAASSPDPGGAMVRLGVTIPAEFSQADLASATASDLKQMEDELLKQYRKLESSGGPKVIQMQPARFETLGGHRALVISYRRASPAGPSPWQVVQYKIPVADRLIELTLSHRESDAVVWRPVLERIRRSMQF